MLIAFWIFVTLVLTIMMWSFKAERWHLACSIAGAGVGGYCFLALEWDIRWALLAYLIFWFAARLLFSLVGLIDDRRKS